MLRILIRTIVTVLVLLGLIALAGAAWMAQAGISARPDPGRIETAVAPRLRSMAIPRAARARVNPLPSSSEIIAQGLEHFADHCAVCHGNDGAGDTEIGRGLYPRAPDMRRPATQNLTDGELFYIIENGVKLTGMPAWSSGTPEGEQESWKLVRFIRHQPDLTEAELQRMTELNPKSAEEWQEAEEARKFLGGAGDAPKAPPAHKHGGRE